LFGNWHCLHYQWLIYEHTSVPDGGDFVSFRTLKIVFVLTRLTAKADFIWFFIIITSKLHIFNARFEILTEVLLKNQVFYDHTLPV
jgi:hypothetical protein